MVLSGLSFCVYSPALPCLKRMMEWNSVQTWPHSLMGVPPCQSNRSWQERAYKPVPIACSTRKVLICSHILAYRLCNGPASDIPKTFHYQSVFCCSTVSSTLFLFFEPQIPLQLEFKATSCIGELSSTFLTIINCTTNYTFPYLHNVANHVSFSFDTCCRVLFFILSFLEYQQRRSFS